MRQELSYALVGLFVIVLGSAWIGISLWLAYGDIDKNYRGYRIYMNESVSGLYIDAPVKYRGVEVGKVRSMELNPRNYDQVRITVDVDSEVEIREDTVATLSVQGLTGIAFIELTGGTAESPPLVAGPDEKLPVLKTGPSLFLRMDAAISELLTNVNEFTNNADELMNGQARVSLQRSLENLESLTRMLAAREDLLDASLRDASAFFRNSSKAAAELPEVMERFNRSAGAVEAMANSLAAAGDSVDRTVREAGTRLSGLGDATLPRIDALVAEMRQLMVTLERLARQIEEEPRIFIYGNELRAPGPGE